MLELYTTRAGRFSCEGWLWPKITGDDDVHIPAYNLRK